MRSIVLLAAALVVVMAGPAKADNFLDLEGGLTTPLGNDDWKNTVESSPKLAVHVGAIPKSIGGMLAVDWTPYNTDTTSSTFPGGSTDISAHRFRVLGNLVFASPVKAKVMVTGRVGVGIDYQHYSSSLTVLGSTRTSSDSDLGIAFEMAGGVWFKLGGVAVGGELAIPISHHDKNTNTFDFVYDTYDLDLLFGVRLLAGD